MAALNQTPYFNDALIAPTATERAQIQDTSTGLVGAVSPVWTCDLANCPAPLQLSVPDASASSSSYSTYRPVPFPLKIVGVDLGAVTAGGATGTMDLEYSDDDGSTWASVFSAAKDVKTGAPKAADYAPNDDACDMDRGWLLRAKATSGSGGSVTGATATVWFVRR